jgi:hypothetical protein
VLVLFQTIQNVFFFLKIFFFLDLIKFFKKGDDNNGCTDQVCVNNTCIYTDIDCWSELSLGNCTIGKTVSAPSNATSYSLYLQQQATNNYVTPAFSAGNRNCEEMACFGGQRSQYVCTSTSNATHTCDRVPFDCTKGGCQDQICRSSTTWNNGQLATDCIVAFDTVCNSDRCNIRNCNTSFVYGDNLNGRCTTTSNSSLCIDNDVCTVDGICDISTGCSFTQATPSPAQNTTCFEWKCNGPTIGWESAPKNNCPQNTSNLCIVKK